MSQKDGDRLNQDSTASELEDQLETRTLDSGVPQKELIQNPSSLGSLGVLKGERRAGVKGTEVRAGVQGKRAGNQTPRIVQALHP